MYDKLVIYGSFFSNCLSVLTRVAVVGRQLERGPATSKQDGHNIGDGGSKKVPFLWRNAGSSPEEERRTA